MKINPSEIENRTISITQYMNTLKGPFREKFLTARQEYPLKNETLKTLEQYACSHFLVIFSAEWCKDCWTAIAALSLINEATRIRVRIFSGLKKDVLGYAFKWRIPPSPPEVNSFGVDKIPAIFAFDSVGVQLGRIVEKPRRMPSIEEELVEIIKDSASHS